MIRFLSQAFDAPLEIGDRVVVNITSKGTKGTVIEIYHDAISPATFEAKQLYKSYFHMRLHNPYIYLVKVDKPQRPLTWQQAQDEEMTLQEYQLLPIDSNFRCVHEDLIKI